MFKGEKKELKMFWRALEARRRRGKLEKLRRCNSFGSWGEISKLNKISVKKSLRDFKIDRVNMFQCVYVSELPQREAAIRRVPASCSNTTPSKMEIAP